MGVEVLVFDGDGSLDQVRWNVREGNEASVFVFVDFVKKNAVSIVDFGGEDWLVFGQF